MAIDVTERIQARMWDKNPEGLKFFEQQYPLRRTGKPVDIANAIVDAGKPCDYCRMTISDERFGGQLITRKGKAYAFDSIECLASFYVQQPATAEMSKVWVADYANPGEWIPAASAVFARSEAHQSPMGLNLVSFSPKADSAALPRELRVGAMSWPQVLAVVQREWNSRPLALEATAR